MVERFEVGKYYRWIGPSGSLDNFNGHMAAFQDGVPRLCESSVGNHQAEFEDIDGGHWYYGHLLEYFEEVSSDAATVSEQGRRSIRRSYAGYAFMTESILEGDEEAFLVGKPVGHISENKYGVITRVSRSRIYFRSASGEAYSDRSNLLLIKEMRSTNPFLRDDEGNLWKLSEMASASSVLVEQAPYRWRDAFGLPSTLTYGKPLSESTFMARYNRLNSVRQSLMTRIMRPKKERLDPLIEEILHLLPGWSLCPLCGSFQNEEEPHVCPSCERIINHIPVCAVCGGDASEEILRRIDGAWVRVCRTHSVGEVKCTECGSGFMRETPDESLICPACRANVETCVFCGVQENKRRMRHYKTLPYCEHCSGQGLPGSYHGTNARNSPRFMGNPPSNFKLYLGAEIEVDFDHASGSGGDSTGPAGAVARRIQHLAPDLRLEITSDGSLDRGMEIVTQPMAIDAWRANKAILASVARELVRFGFRGHDAKTAGLHVHVSRAAFKEATETVLPFDQRVHYSYFRLAFLMKRFERELLAFSRRTSDRKDRYARALIRDTLFRELMQEGNEGRASAIFYNGIEEGNRYVELNKEFGPTYEFRLFRSTLKVDTLIATVELVQLLCEYILTASWEELKSISWNSLIDRSTSRELHEYNARIMATSAPHGDGTEVETEE